MVQEATIVYGIAITHYGITFHTAPANIQCMSFYCRLKSSKDRQILVRKEKDVLSFSMTNIDISSEYMCIKNLTELSEEEFFQESLVWKHNFSIELVREMQVLGIGVLQYPSTIREGTVLESVIQY